MEDIKRVCEARGYTISEFLRQAARNEVERQYPIVSIKWGEMWVTNDEESKQIDEAA